MSRGIGTGVLWLMAACSSAVMVASDRDAPRVPASAPRAGAAKSEGEATSADTPPAFLRGWLARFPGCDSPAGYCQCDDRVLGVPHVELERRPAEPSGGRLLIAEIDLNPLQLTYFAPAGLDPPGTCLSGPCPEEGPLRYELVGPGGRTSRHYGTWSCARGDSSGKCKGPIETWSGSSMSNAWVDIAPDDQQLRLFVGDRLVYSIERSTQPIDVRVVLLKEPEHTLAFSFGQAEREGTFMSLGVAAPGVDALSTSLKVQRRPGGCWTLAELGDLPFVDPLSLQLHDGFRTARFELPLQDGVPAAVGPQPSSSTPEQARARARPRAELARQSFGSDHVSEGVDLSSADLRKSRFSAVNAAGLRLRKARLQWAHLRECSLPGADFREADLSFAHLVDSSFPNADFRGANLEGARLDDSTLEGANLDGARNLTQAQLDAACGDRRTTLPPGLRLPTCEQRNVNHWATSSSGAGKPASSHTERLVATPSSACTMERCPGQCCQSCGRLQWKLPSDPDVQIVHDGVLLPDLPATECGVHYDLRAQGERDGDRFVLHVVRPVPSERGRRAGTPAQLELEARLSDCVLVGDNRYCTFEGWRPVPTRDEVTWSGQPLPDGKVYGYDYDLAVTGTWRGPRQFHVETVRQLKPWRFIGPQ